MGASAASVNKSTGFCCMSVTSGMLHSGALVRDDL